jgi:hypothetical protein
MRTMFAYGRSIPVVGSKLLEPPIMGRRPRASPAKSAAAPFKLAPRGTSRCNRADHDP